MRQVAETLLGKVSLSRISAQLTMTCQCSLLLCKIAHPGGKAIVHDTLPSARVSNVHQFLAAIAGERDERPDITLRGWGRRTLSGRG